MLANHTKIMESVYQFIVTNISWILLGVFAFALLNQLFYYFFFYIRLAVYRDNNQESTETFPVSVVICARNERENLKKYLPSILDQDYPEYEVIVVNDSSEDDSDLVLAEFNEKYEHFRYTEIIKDHKFSHGKKLALTVGLKSAKYNWVLLTDADCEAQSNKWLRKMQRHFSPSTDFVIAYGGYFNRKGLLNKIIRADAFFTALSYLSFALAKVPYMGVGRNLAYRKELFFKTRGFAGHSTLISGDDDLFVNSNANKERTKIEIHPDAHTRTEAELTFSNWIKQKRRHITTGKYYKTFHRFLLAHEYSTRISLHIAFIFLLVMKSPFMHYILGAYVFRLLVQIIIFMLAMKKLDEKKLIAFTIVYDFISPFFNFGLFLLNSIKRKAYR